MEDVTAQTCRRCPRVRNLILAVREGATNRNVKTHSISRQAVLERFEQFGGSTKEGMIVTTVALPPDLHRRLAVLAIEEHAASAELIREAIQEYLERRERQRAKRRQP